MRYCKVFDLNLNQSFFIITLNIVFFKTCHCPFMIELTYYTGEGDGGAQVHVILLTTYKH
jgi:hypothetical protein